jgi:hypothetical protein
VRRTLEEGPQVVTRRGEGVIVTAQAEEFDRLNLREEGLKDFLLRAAELETLEIRRLWRSAAIRVLCASSSWVELALVHQRRLRGTQGGASQAVR